MEYYIDDRREPEAKFWNSLHGIASERKKCFLLEGKNLVIGGVTYQIIFSEEE